MSKDSKTKTIKTLDDNFENDLLDYTVTLTDLTENKYEFLGVATGKDGYKDLHVFNKDKMYYYFKYHKGHFVVSDEYEFIIKTDHKAEDITKEYD